MFSWRLRNRVLPIGPRCLVMGIVNVTPDSFSDGGQFSQTDAAIAHGLELVRQGADLLDVGGESTRPGAEPVPADEELRRVVAGVGTAGESGRASLSADTPQAGRGRARLSAPAPNTYEPMRPCR